MPLDQIFAVLVRDRLSVSGTVRTLMNDANATWKFTTGALAHTLIFGAELDHEEADLTRYTNQDTAIIPTPLLAPDPNEAFPGHQNIIRQRPDTKADTVGLYAVDTVDFGAHWSLTAALRWDRFDASFNEPITHAHFAHTDFFASPRAALVYKPDENTSFYFSWGTSFNPSAENLSLSARTADLGPEKDHTFELRRQGAADGRHDLRHRRVVRHGDGECAHRRSAQSGPAGARRRAPRERLRGERGRQHITDHWEVIAELHLSRRKLEGPVQLPQPQRPGSQHRAQPGEPLDDL